MARFFVGVLLTFALVSLGLAASFAWVFYSDCPAARSEKGALEGFVLDPPNLARDGRLVILLPGALNSMDIFAWAEPLKSQGFSFARYRMPGLDGRPLDDIVTIKGVALEVLELIEATQPREVHIIGFSLGAQVALEAAALAPDKVKSVVSIAGAVGFPDTFEAGYRAIGWLVRRAWQTSTLDLARVWKDYYKVLLFGEAGATDPALSRQADALVAARSSRIVTPTRTLACSHMRDIALHTAVDPARLATKPVLFVHGRYDVVSSMSRVKDYSGKFKNGRLIVLDEGHQIFLTDKNLAARVADFLK